ncbi:response regulator transcription factor [Curvibacter sp. CHRR-16]|uniref:LytR/AlgR family response regulator transcription factor n=1 Tax=Curvibacter sp. CHRR-16 TaxID=2835872 RepID=UPI001BDA1FDE|nr:LytTR family DNA-binding domain-containing protein [Curvibacter sp. CHRR-16]MBT0570119.1 response regulator transcription factor [Curvibacter sp. CHRR-16]
MNTLRVIVADDERLMREQLCQRLQEVAPHIDIVAQARNGSEAVALTAQHQPDVVFLDIRMPGLSGIEAAQAISQLPTWDETGTTPWAGCEMVFVTAYDQYAVAAFEQGVVDYVLKPAEHERLALTLQRLQDRLEARLQQRHSAADASMMPLHTPSMHRLLQQLSRQLASPAPVAAAPAPLQWIQATVGNSIQLIPIDEVLFFMSDDKYTRVQTATQQALIRTPIKELLNTVDMDKFWQIHRSTLVNTRAIAKVTRDHRGRQIVSLVGCDETLEVSRSFAGLFKGM